MFRFHPSRVRDAYLRICIPGLVDFRFGLYPSCIIRANGCFCDITITYPQPFVHSILLDFRVRPASHLVAICSRMLAVAALGSG